jgi:hypothetical protein
VGEEAVSGKRVIASESSLSRLTEEQQRSELLTRHQPIRRIEAGEDIGAADKLDAQTDATQARQEGRRRLLARVAAEADLDAVRLLLLHGAQPLDCLDRSQCRRVSDVASAIEIDQQIESCGPHRGDAGALRLQ